MRLFEAEKADEIEAAVQRRKDYWVERIALRKQQQLEDIKREGAHVYTARLLSEARSALQSMVEALKPRCTLNEEERDQIRREEMANARRGAGLVPRVYPGA